MYLPRWTFDSVQQECVEFIYGGCDGNENNFKTRKECQDNCYAESKYIMLKCDTLLVATFIHEISKAFHLFNITVLKLLSVILP